ncbi:MAG: DUF6265 family protein [Gemmatimonadota bacterium]
MRVLLLPVLLAGALGSTASARATPASQTATDTLPVWMAGCWEQRRGDRITREDWTAPLGGMMFGLSVTLRGDSARAWEFLRIAPGERGPAYHASPSGQAPTTFAWADAGPDWIVFEDPQHDFPQRIRYERLGADSLRALVGTMDGTRGFEVRWGRRDC